MAKYYSSYGKSNRGGRKKKKQTYGQRITQLARDMAVVEKGKKNPDSQVYTAYQNALTGSGKKNKKPLY